MSKSAGEGAPSGLPAQGWKDQLIDWKSQCFSPLGSAPDNGAAPFLDPFWSRYTVTTLE